MDWKAVFRTEGSKLQRLIALLLSLAVLAERASRMPGPVRRVSLYFLRRAEAVAYSIVYWELRDHGAPLFWAAPDSVRTSADPDAAIALGRWFRILALALRDLPLRALLVLQARARRRAAACSCGEGLAALPRQEPRAPDTS